MNKESQETMRGLLVKLSAVRMTLSDDEQAMLDRMVQGYRGEVAAHAFDRAAAAAATPAAAEVAAHAFDRAAAAAATPAAAEVAAHVKYTSADEADLVVEDEVVAHMFFRKRGSTDVQRAGEDPCPRLPITVLWGGAPLMPGAMRIYYDGDRGGYKIAD